MATLAAKDQENFAHGLHAQAARKPLNAALGHKTPANRAPNTPFKVALNDENAVKGGRSLLHTKAKHATLDNAFVTPAGPRTRAPLGMKTTNAKAAAFQTPAPLSASAKTQKLSPRLRRPKVKIQPDVQSTEQDDVPEVEYMPPKEVPLLDDYNHLPRDWNIPKLENGGVWESYHNPLEDDGRTKLQRRFDETLDRDRKKRDDDFDRKLNGQIEEEEAEIARHFGVEMPRKKATGPSTLKAKSAAAALCGPSKPAYAAPTAATKSRLPSRTVASKKPVVAPSASRHAAAAAASKTTIGYAQGRENTILKSHARKPLSNVTKPAPFSVSASRPSAAPHTHNRNASTSSVAVRSRGAFSRSSSTSTNATLVAPPQQDAAYQTAEDIERELELMLLRQDDGPQEEAWANSFSIQLDGGDPFDEDLEDFQLQLPEVL